MCHALYALLGPCHRLLLDMWTEVERYQTNTPMALETRSFRIPCRRSDNRVELSVLIFNFNFFYGRFSSFLSWFLFLFLPLTRLFPYCCVGFSVFCCFGRAGLVILTLPEVCNVYLMLGSLSLPSTRHHYVVATFGRKMGWKFSSDTR